jgi:ketosteroid isomerase-like protein
MKRYLPIFTTPFLLALLVFSPFAAGQKENVSPALSSLVEAERSFARTSVEKGIRESFYEFFADDGINFQPHPTNTREAIRKQPAPAQRPPITLNWEPAFADVSRAGDLGYTTGPYWLTDQGPQHRPTRHGYYFSIWKKQADGSWRVVIDAGVQTPAPASSAPPPFHPAPPSQFKAKSAKLNLDGERASLINLEREFLKASKSVGVSRAFQDFMGEDARLHRNGMFPLTEKGEIRSYFLSKDMTLQWEPIKADVSQSGDLGYTYGSYELKEEDASAPSAVTVEKGYYVRVWKRNKDGKWKVVLDTTNPVPPEEKG